MLQRRLGQSGADDPPLLDPGQPLVEAVIEEGQAAVIEAHQRQDRGVQVRDVVAAFDPLEAEFVGKRKREWENVPRMSPFQLPEMEDG